MEIKEIEARMKKALESMQGNFNSIRTGRASASLLDRITVDYYGSPTGLKSLATISNPDSSTLLIQPFDRSALKNIEKAIQESDLGLPPNNDGTGIRLNIPPLTQDRRKALVKNLQALVEEGRVAVRNIRRDGVDITRRREKDKEISEDQSRDLQAAIQKLTDKHIEQIEKLATAKEKEIMTV